MKSVFIGSAIILGMILVTGGTGFIGRTLVRQLVASGHPVRLLLRPSNDSPRLPRGVPVEVAVSSMRDERGLRAAMKDVDLVFHLVGTERQSTRANLMEIDVEGARATANAAVDAGVERFFYLSHLGADRNSAYPVLKAKALAELAIQQSGVPYSIIRTGAVFGAGDQFTEPLAQLLRMSPGIFLMPGDGSVQVQPLWVEDLVTCLLLSLDNSEMINASISIGGVETLSILDIINLLMERLSLRRRILGISPAYLRMIAVFMEHYMPRFPVSIYWLDTLAIDRTCPLDVVPRLFGLMPSRFNQNLEYIQPVVRKPLWRRK